MRRFLISSLALGSAAAAAVPSFAMSAGPAPADSGRAGVVTVTTQLPGGDTLTLDVSAAQLSAGPRLVVDATRCDDSGECDGGPYAASLGSGDLSLDPSAPTGQLSTTLDGRPLVISWQAPSDGLYAEGGTIYGGPDGEWANNFVGEDATTSVQYDGHECQTTGGVGTATVADAQGTNDGSAAQPLSALQLPEDATLHC